MQEFIKVTYNAYDRAVGERFGKRVPAIFTDEPQFSRKGTLAYAQDSRPVTLPWSDDIPETYAAAYGEDLLAKLPELLWDLPDGKVSLTRYHFHDHIAERFAAAFADQCGEHNLMLTGHMMEEPTLESQTAALGEAMRSYRAFQLPGIDMLCDRREFTTAKQTQSAVRQYGREGMLSELYGVTNWDFDFRGHKLQGDWQAALGVTVRVPHLSWISMNGEAKRDYPASFNYQSPWYKEYPYVEDHFARVNTVLTRGKARCRVGVVHPVESYWLHWGAKENTAAIRAQMDARFQNLTEWLLKGLVDFDFISESLLPDQCPADFAGEAFPVGEMAYETIIVPPVETLRTTTIERLSRFAENGGRVIFLGDAPALADAVPSDAPGKLYSVCEHCAFDRVVIMERLADLHDVDGRLSLLAIERVELTEKAFESFRRADARRVLTQVVRRGRARQPGPLQRRDKEVSEDFSAFAARVNQVLAHEFGLEPAPCRTDAAHGAVHVPEGAAALERLLAQHVAHLWSERAWRDGAAGAANAGVER